LALELLRAGAHTLYIDTHMNEDNGQIELTESTQRVQTSAKTVLNDMKIY